MIIDDYCELNAISLHVEDLLQHDLTLEYEGNIKYYKSITRK
jgi:hypothetical protein